MNRSAASILFLSSVVVLGQSKLTKPDDGAARKSFHELLVAKDKGVGAAIGSSQAFVCFRHNSDEFLLASFLGPSQLGWTGDAEDPNAEFYTSYARLDDYQSGAKAQHGVSLFATGRWTRYKDNPNLLSFQGAWPKDGEDPGLDDDTISIDADEFEVNENYKNANGDMIHYSFSVRRSTGRYIESFQMIPTAGDSGGLTHYSGRCDVYEKGKLKP